MAIDPTNSRPTPARDDLDSPAMRRPVDPAIGSTRDGAADPVTRPTWYWWVGGVAVLALLAFFLTGLGGDRDTANNQASPATTTATTPAAPATTATAPVVMPPSATAPSTVPSTTATGPVTGDQTRTGVPSTAQPTTSDRQAPPNANNLAPPASAPAPTPPNR